MVLADNKLAVAVDNTFDMASEASVASDIVIVEKEVELVVLN